MIEIKIKNFKSIKEVEIIEKYKNIISLIGPNDSGKSNILNGITKLGKNSTFESSDFLVEKGLKDSKKIEMELKIEFEHNILIGKVQRFLSNYPGFFVRKNKEIIDFLELTILKGISIKYDILVNVKKNGTSIEPDIDEKFNNESFQEIKKIFWGKIYKFWIEHDLNKIWTISATDDNSILNPYNYHNNFLKNKLKNINVGPMVNDLIELYRSFTFVGLKYPQFKVIANDDIFNGDSDFQLNLLDPEKNLSPEEIQKKI